MSETEVEVEDYEEIVGDLYYDDSVEAVPTADSFQEPTLNQNVSSLTPKNRPILRSSNLSLAGGLQESIPKVVIVPPDSQLPPQLPSITAHRPVPNYTAW